MPSPIDFDAELANITAPTITFTLAGQTFEAEGQVSLGQRREMLTRADVIMDEQAVPTDRLDRVIDMAVELIVPEDQERFRAVVMTLDERALSHIVRRLMTSYEARPTQEGSGSGSTSGRDTDPSTDGALPATSTP